MKTYISAEDVLSLTAPSGGVLTGIGYVIDSLFVVAQASVAQTLPFAAIAAGVVDLPKLSTAVFTEGEKIFWDDAAKQCKESATGYFKIGVCVKAAGNPSSSVWVKLNSVDVVAV